MSLCLLCLMLLSCCCDFVCVCEKCVCWFSLWFFLVHFFGWARLHWWFRFFNSRWFWCCCRCTRFSAAWVGWDREKELRSVDGKENRELCLHENHFNTKSTRKPIWIGERIPTDLTTVSLVRQSLYCLLALIVFSFDFAASLDWPVAYFSVIWLIGLIDLIPCSIICWWHRYSVLHSMLPIARLLLLPQLVCPKSCFASVANSPNKWPNPYPNLINQRAIHGRMAEQNLIKWQFLIAKPKGNGSCRISDSLKFLPV